MNKNIENIIKNFKNKIFNKFSDKIIDFIVFGSYARGKESPESDLDILIVVSQKDKEIESEILEIAYEIMWENNFRPLISVEIMTKEHFEWLKEVKSSFYENIEKEGIRV